MSRTELNSNDSDTLYGNPLVHKIYVNIGGDYPITSQAQAISNLIASSGEHDFEITVEFDDKYDIDKRQLDYLLKERIRWQTGHEYRVPRFRIILNSKVNNASIYNTIKEYDHFYPEIEVLIFAPIILPLDDSSISTIKQRIDEHDPLIKGNLLLLSSDESIFHMDYAIINDLFQYAYEQGCDGLFEIDPLTALDSLENISSLTNNIQQLFNNSRVKLFDCGLLGIADRVVKGNKFLNSPIIFSFRCGATTYGDSFSLGSDIRTCFYTQLNRNSIGESLEICDDCSMVSSCSGCFILSSLGCNSCRQKIKIISDLFKIVSPCYQRDAIQFPILQFDWDYQYDDLDGV